MQRSFKQFLRESNLGGSHSALLKQWLASGSSHPEDPDDRGAELENPIQASERRIREFNSDKYSLLNFDYKIQDVDLSKLKSIQAGFHDESMIEMAKQHLSQQYAKLHRKHDVLPILLAPDNTIIDGYHRVAAAKYNGLTTIPALVPAQPGTGKIIGTY